MENKFVRYLVFLSAISFSCSSESPPSLADNRENPAMGLANPAVIKCIKDGYDLKVMKKNGVPMGYFCVNQKTGKQCEIWSYFRGECDIAPLKYQH